MKSKFTNGGFLIALISMILYLLGSLGLATWMPPWLGPTLTGLVTVLWIMGIVSDTNGKGIWNFTGVPLRQRLEDPTVLKAIIAWVVMLINNLTVLFKWNPLPFDLNVVLMTLLAITQLGGFVKGWPAGTPATDPAAAIAPSAEQAANESV